MIGREGPDSPTVVVRCRECGASFPTHDWDRCPVFVTENAVDEPISRSEPEDHV